MVRIRQRGFTMVELLVVFAMIAVMMAMLLPAVQQAREAARRTQCKNNLKQLGLAMHNYYQSVGVFPACSYVNIWSNDPNASDSEWSWAVMLLPHLDQSNLFQSLNVNKITFEQAANDPARYALMTRSPSVFLCPTDPGPDVNLNRPFIAKTAGGVGLGMVLPITTSFGKSNYAACNGNHGNDGIFDSGNTTQITIRDVTDGLTNTILMGERSSTGWRDQPPGTAGPWACIWVGHESSQSDITNVWCLAGKTEFQMNTGAPSGVPQGTSNIPEPLEAFGSAHPGGAHFLMADGSVRFISDKIQWNDLPNSYNDVGIYHLLGSRADGLPIGEY